MYDVEFDLTDQPGALATLGETMGRAGISFEGGGVFSRDGRSTAHFLFENGEAARVAADAASLKVVAVRKALIRKLKQGTPGQLGAIARSLAGAGVNIHAQYSDHYNRLILICDKPEIAAQATLEWSDGA